VQEDAETASFLRYYGRVLPSDFNTGEMMSVCPGEGSCFSPYKYGWAWEAKIHTGFSADNFRGRAVVTKHFSMGRLSYKESYVMPDDRTVYTADTAQHGGVFTKFVASEAQDLSAGELFCAKLTQLTPAGGAAHDSRFAIEWISMGATDDSTIRDAIGINDPFPGTTDTTQHKCHKRDDVQNPLLTFDDIFDARDVHDSVADTGANEQIANDVGHNNGRCAAGYTSIRTASKPDSYECLRLRQGMEIHASRFETRRYAAYLGCTTEFSHVGGISYNAKAGKVFMAVSSVQGQTGGMEANINVGVGGTDHIKLAPNTCGCVFSMSVTDSSVTDMEVLMCGTPKAEDPDNNKCQLNGLSNPENVAMMEDMDQLLISDKQEGNRRNNAVFVYDFDSKSLTRIFTAPEGGETTNPAYWPDIHGNTYVSMVIQHPLTVYTNGRSDWEYRTIGQRQIDNAYTGYLHFKRTKAELESPVWHAITSPKGDDKHLLRFSQAVTWGAMELQVKHNHLSRTGDSFLRMQMFGVFTRWVGS